MRECAEVAITSLNSFIARKSLCSPSWARHFWCRSFEPDRAAPVDSSWSPFSDCGCIFPMSTRTLVSLSIVMGLSVTGCPEKQAETSAEPAAAEEKIEDKPAAAEVEKADEAAGAKDEGADKEKDGEKEKEEEEGGW